MKNAIDRQVLRSSGSLFVEENMLVFLTEGKLNLRFGQSEFVVDKTNMIFLRKNILVQYKAEEAGCILISLKHELVTEFVKLAQINVKVNKGALPVIVDSVNSQLSVFLDTLGPYFAEQGPLTRFKLLELLFNLSHSDNRILGQLMDLRQQFRIDITSTVEENIMNSLSVNQLAELAGRSLSSFRRDFLAIYNMPPSQWIRQRRLEKARELLVSTTMTVTDVCYTLGFENLAHFSRLFKSYFGHSPSGYKLTAQAA
jgi:AraC-like DNA-binding protein